MPDRKTVRPSRRVLIAGGAVLAAALALAGAGAAGLLSGHGHSAAGHSDGLRHTGVDASAGSCGTGWHDPRPGTQVFDVHNTSSVPVEVYLKDASSGAVYGEVEGLGPGTTRALRVTIASGSYAFGCFPDDAASVTGPTVRVPSGGDGSGSSGKSDSSGESGSSGPAAVPVSQHDLIPPTLSYQKWVTGRMGSLVGAARQLDTAVRADDPARARKAWLTAHLDYERLGAAYGTFGDADAAINGTTAGLAGGVHDKDFTGFHRIEYGLWHGESATALRPFADRLVKDVVALRTDWRQARMDPLDLGLRAHEILENTVQFELTGRTDYGSGSNLATARANLDGTRVVLSRLRPVLSGRYPGLKTLDAELDRTQAVLDRQEHGGHWTAPARLGRAEREKVNAAVSGLVERLADIAALCDVRRSS
ncbi:EfeM/EfeO family lipoprotein [Streptomyces sp. NBC_01089]|uniref:EfeM/EfeO family lipoprotein n=1 Tax=Streptomyces sp. NBC_01089 TaxID=2903747 RepID=UPI0038665297|nr:EfeM/EfeO family lipoprotein [Streptomyces sp. NBC_01089]